MERIEDAIRIILEHTPLAVEEDIPLMDSMGRVLRRDAISDLDLPPFNRSRMDGYALRAADVEKATGDQPAKLRAIGEAAAGSHFSGRVETGEAVRIMTGAPVPEGADAVQKIEVIRVLDDGRIEVR